MKENKKKIQSDIQELNLAGFSQESIAKRLGICKTKVSKVIQKVRKESDGWIINLARKNYANLYKEALDGLKQDLAYLYDLSQEESVKNDPKLGLQIRRQITYVRSIYVKNLISAPAVWSVQVLAKNCIGEPIPEAIMESLGGISGNLK
jgi:biotin operon repressor